jgi:hypothetical protein
MASDDLCNLEPLAPGDLYSMEDLVRKKDCEGILEFRKKTKKQYKTFLENFIKLFFYQSKYISK